MPIPPAVPQREPVRQQLKQGSLSTGIWGCKDDQFAEHSWFTEGTKLSVPNLAKRLDQQALDVHELTSVLDYLCEVYWNKRSVATVFPSRRTAAKRSTRLLRHCIW